MNAFELSYYSTDSNPFFPPSAYEKEIQNFCPRNSQEFFSNVHKKTKR